MAATWSPRRTWRRGVFGSFLVMVNRFLFSSPAITSSAPHIRDANNVQRVWNYFVIASMPAWLIGLWSLGRQINLAMAQLTLESAPGWRGWVLDRMGIGFDAFNVVDCIAHGLIWFLPVFVTALLVGAFWEAIFSRLRHKDLDEGLMVTAWLFALLMPAAVPLYQVGLGMTFGIVVGKLIYGGSGRYLVNPALLGLVFLMSSYPSLLFGTGAWVPVDGYDQPPLLELVMDEGGLKVISALDYTWWQLFIGDHPGAIGTTSIFGALLGAIFLVYTGMASWRVMLGALAGLLIAALVFNTFAQGNTLFAVPWYWHFVLGGFAFGTVFLAADPVAGAVTDPGRWGYGLAVGFLTVVIRNTNPSYYEGVMFSILLASMIVPLIDHVVIARNIRRRIRRQGVTGER